MIEFVPYQRCGELHFGMSQDQVVTLLGPPQSSRRNWLGATEMFYPLYNVGLGYENSVVSVCRVNPLADGRWRRMGECTPPRDAEQEPVSLAHGDNGATAGLSACRRPRREPWFRHIESPEALAEGDARSEAHRCLSGWTTPRASAPAQNSRISSASCQY